MRGSISFDQLRQMPLNQYSILKKAVEIEILIERRMKIYDLNRAFHSPEDLFKQLEVELSKMLKETGVSKSTGTVDWGKDPDWMSKLKKIKI